MTKTEKPELVSFPKEFNAQQILSTIKEKQDAWAKKHPELANKLYPKVFDKNGNRIK